MGGRVRVQGTRYGVFGDVTGGKVRVLMILEHKGGGVCKGFPLIGGGFWVK